MYVLLKAKIEKLLSNYYIIKYFRYKPRREFRDPVEFKYTFTSLKIALSFILEIKSNKLHLQSGENFKQLLKASKKKSKETQTSLEDLQFHEVELHEFYKENYSGEVSVSHFTQNPKDLELFIADFYAMAKLVKLRD